MPTTKIFCLELAATVCTCALALAQNPGKEPTPSPGNEPDRAQATEHDHAHQQLTSFLAAKLMQANHNEIELSKLASDRSSHKQVVQLAETITEEHTHLNQRLKRFCPDAPEEHATESEGQRSKQSDTIAENDTLSQLKSINRQAAVHHLQRSKQMLDNFQGQDFDMAFLGMQIAAHNRLLSELDALDGIGSDEFKQVVSAAWKKIEQHRDHAVSLARQLEDDRRTAQRDKSTR